MFTYLRRESNVVAAERIAPIAFKLVSAGISIAPKPNKSTKGATFVIRPGTMDPSAPRTLAADWRAAAAVALKPSACLWPEVDDDDEGEADVADDDDVVDDEAPDTKTTTRPLQLIASRPIKTPPTSGRVCRPALGLLLCAEIWHFWRLLFAPLWGSIWLLDLLSAAKIFF